jgi:hypothetical protein
VTGGQADINTSNFEKWNSSNESSYPYVIRSAAVDGSTTQLGLYNIAGTPSNPFNAISTTPGQWVQFVGAVSFTDGNSIVYRNGVNIQTVSIAGMANVSNSSLVGIATRLNTSSQPTTNESWKGTISTIRIYDKTLTDAEVLQNFNADKSKYGL